MVYSPSQGVLNQVGSLKKEAPRQGSSTSSKPAEQVPQDNQDNTAPASPPDTGRKLVRNAQVELGKCPSFEETVQKITAIRGRARVEVISRRSNSQKQANGKASRWSGRGEGVPGAAVERISVKTARSR